MTPRKKTSFKGEVDRIMQDVRALRREIDGALYVDDAFCPDDAFETGEIEEQPVEFFLARFERIRERVEQMEETTETLYNRCVLAERRLEGIMQTNDGSVWTRPTAAKNPPPFISLAKRPFAPGGGKTKFLSFVNLKGGVGKTTLTANLVAAFASGNYRDENGKIGKPARVLAVDLDFQGTLSQRCAAPLALESAYLNDLTSRRLLEKPSESRILFDDLSVPFIGASNAELIPANEELDNADVRRLNQLAGSYRETRYFFRFWFHFDEVFRKYDYVFFDCPPRLTASSVCALLASDFAFVPTAPESFDVNAVSRTLNWIGKTRQNLSPHLQYGGALLNRTNNEKGLTPIEEQNKGKIGLAYQDFRKHFSNAPDWNPVLDAFIPRRSGGNHINGADGAALTGASSIYFNNLATEIYRRIQ